MTRQQSTVIWVGLILVAMNIVINWAEIKPVIFGSGVSAAVLASKTGVGSISTSPNQAVTNTPSAVQVMLWQR